ncbi:unnamed protein product [Mytilus coruscus]|uniref:G-protein coupled receptors family 1 profile domain-containing protein n=1 Tax=Mytilus coruscus TaxID=42192 RepID=A0A6J8D6F0_MYTCO|nr:unnamed protein product [Mytilus coruscus]
MLFTLYARVPIGLNIVAGPTLCYISTVMNIVVFVTLFDKKIRTPSTILMQGLAVADGITALSTYGMEPIFNLFYENIGKPGSPNVVDSYSHTYGYEIQISIEETQNLVDLKYPYCVVHYCLSHLADNFHLVSILLTTSLGIQKILALAMPIWSRINITNSKSVIVCCSCFLFSMALNIPRMFVVSMKSENGDACFVTKPSKTIEWYVLTIYPILFAILLTIAIAVMISSACYIVFILCRRKQVRGHAKISNCERKSCVLILSVMSIFLLSELPRLVIYGAVFKTFIYGTRNENIASYKVGKEIEYEMLACYQRIEDELISEWNIQREISSCFRVTNSSEIQEEIEEYVGYSAEWSGYLWYIKKEIEDKIKNNYEELISNAGQLMDSPREDSSSGRFRRFLTTLYCNEIDDLDIYWINIDFEDKHVHCGDSIFPLLFNILPFLILGSTPYSEPMNYILNIIWGNFNISLEHLKLLIEVLKIFMVIGCASNFIIYVIMSEKLRSILLKKIVFWSNHTETDRNKTSMSLTVSN